MTHSGGSLDGSTLVVEGVTKKFVGLVALDNVSLELHQGEILGLIGPNGSGKTTLINVITGLLPSNGGRILAGGIDITDMRPHRITHTGVARTYQTIRLFPELSVLENVEVAGVCAGLSRRAARKRAYRVLGELGIEEWAPLKAGALPYGRERSVEIARAVANRPKFLLLDEPAAGLNEEESDDLLRRLASIPQERELGMLIVDHDMRLIMRLCDRLHVLNYGKTIGEGTPAEVRQIPAVVEAYLGSAARGD